MSAIALTDKRALRAGLSSKLKLIAPPQMLSSRKFRKGSKSVYSPVSLSHVGLVDELSGVGEISMRACTARRLLFLI